MKFEGWERWAVAAALAWIFGSTGCSSAPANCPVCGTDKNATVGLIDVMAVPGHSASGAPGGPFNFFDISWMDPTNHMYYVSDNIGVDVAAFNTVNNIAVAAIGGDSSIAESGNQRQPVYPGRRRKPNYSSPHLRARKLRGIRVQDGKLSTCRAFLAPTGISADSSGAFVVARAATICFRSRVRMGWKPRPMGSSCLPAMALRT